jgi:LysM repeat protein
VADGDTWYSIAEAFGVDAETLAAANGRTLDDYIRIGETLVIPR